MNVEEIRKKVRSLCEDAGLQFFFAVPNASEWAVTDCEHLRKIVSYHKELETLPLVTPTQKWIHVSEEYPNIEDEYKYFLVTDEKGKVSVQKFLLSLDEEPQPYFSGMVNVIAWMPLPKPYKAEM